MIKLGTKGFAFNPESIIAIAPHETDKNQSYIWLHTGHFFTVGIKPAEAFKVLNDKQ